MSTYTVKPGDTLSSIAAQHGIESWQTLYYDPSNASFRAKRLNPNLIFPGDQIQIPAVHSKSPAGNVVSPRYWMAVIDGTGDADETKYRSDMQNSFCTQLGRTLQANGAGTYFLGPSMLGKEVEPKAKEVYQALKVAHDANPAARLMMAGYSRGGSIAILAAELLEKEGISIDSLFLFDAVARWRGDGGEVIPANVDYSCHARRDISARLVLKYEGTVSTDGYGLSNSSNPIRPFFSNTGLKWRCKKSPIQATFHGSHGAMGGVGWSFVTEDPACQQKVASWMSGRLQERGVSVQLKSMPIHSPPAAIPTATEIITGWALDALLLTNHAINVKRGGRKP